MSRLPIKVFTIKLNQRHKITYYGVNIDSKPTVLVFSNKESSEKCAHFIKTFKQKYKQWPPLEMKAKIQINNKNEKKKEEDIEINEASTGDWMCYARSEGLTSVCVVNYEPNIQTMYSNIDFKGYEITNSADGESNFESKFKLEYIPDIIT